MVARHLWLLALVAPSMSQAQVSGAPQILSLTLDQTYSTALPNNELLLEVSAIAIRADGIAYVLDRSSASIVQFGQNGRAIRVFGRKGDGPGEFRSPYRLGLLADTLWVSDRTHRRVSFFSADGRFLKSENIMSPASASSAASAPIALTKQGFAIAIPGSVTVGKEPIVERSVPIVRISRKSQAVDTITVMHYSDRQPVIQLSVGRTSYLTDPMPERPLRVVSPDGRLVLVVERTSRTQQVGYARVLIFDSDGRQRLAKTYRTTPVSVSKISRDSILARYVAAYKSSFPSELATKQAVSNALQLPEFYPSISSAGITNDGRFYLAMPSDGTPVRWTVFSERGDELFAFDLPRESQVVSMAAQFVWVMSTDHDGVNTISRHRLAK